MRVIALQLGPWLFNHWTPFNELAPEEAVLAGLPARPRTAAYPARSTVRARGVAWGAKVLSVLWADNGSFEVDSFVRGSWEEEALVL